MVRGFTSARQESSLRLVKLYAKDGQENATLSQSRKIKEVASLKTKGPLYSYLLTTRLPSERRIHLETKPPIVAAF